MKFSLVGSFDLADGYLGAAKALEKAGIEVCFIPAQKYLCENGHSIHIKMIKEDLIRDNPDYVLWWRGETLGDIDLKNIKKTINKPFILYSWDDPFQWEVHRELPAKCRFLDYAFTCCRSSVEFYKKFGCFNSFYCPPGFDPEIHYPEEDENYKCDISFVCTNLYHGNSLTKMPHVSRKNLLDIITKEFNGLDIRLYGFENFKEIYPEIYKGWIPFNESRKVFYNSKINLNSHIRPDGHMYINERVSQILGSGGLLLVDNVEGIENVLDINSECFVYDKKDVKTVIDKIKEILLNEERAKEVSNNGYKKAICNFTWDNWARNVMKGIKLL